MTSYRPKLRAFLRLEDGKLLDGLLDRSFPLEGAVAAVAPRLDGSQEWPAIRASLIADGLDGDDLDASLRGLLCCHLVDGAGDPLVAKLTDVVSGAEELPVAILDGARFACQGSGGCCTGYVFGPLSDRDVARLDDLDLAAAFPHLTAPYLEDGEHGRYLRRDGDRCIFLGADRKCGLHAAFGAEAKPGFCRQYPLDAFATLEGLRVVDRGTCATFAISARKGLPLVDDLPRVRTLLERPGLHHPLAFVDARPWDYGLFLRFTTAAAELVARERGTASETVAAVARMLSALAGAVHDCPLEAGQPDGVVTEVLATNDGAWYRDPDHVAAIIGQRRLVSLLDEVAPATREAIEDGTARSTAARYGELCELMEAIADRIVEQEGSAPVAVHAPDVEDALRLSMKQQLFGRRALVGGHAGPALVRIALIQLFALAAARQQAGARPLTAADLNRGHSLATRVLESGAMDRVLLIHEAWWRELVLGIAIAARVVSAPPPLGPPSAAEG